MSRQVHAAVPPPSREAIAQQKNRVRREAELKAFSKHKIKGGLGFLIKGSLTGAKEINANEMSPLAVPAGDSSNPTVLPPSWASNVMSLEEMRAEDAIAQQTETIQNAYPPPVPKLTQAQQQMYKKTDLIGGTSAAALATATAGKDALNMVGSAISYIVPKVIRDAPLYMLEGAVNSVGVNLASYDLTDMEQVARVNFFKMEREAPLLGLVIALKRIMITFRDFKFNKAIATDFLRKLYAILAAFTKPYTGVIAKASYEENKPLTDGKVQACLGAIEEILDKGNKFLCKFTSLDGSLESHAFPRNPALDTLPSPPPVSLSTTALQPYVQLPNDPYSLRPQDLSPQEALLYALPSNISASSLAPPRPAGAYGTTATASLFNLGGIIPGSAPPVRPVNNVIGKRNFVCDYLVMVSVVGKELQEFLTTFHGDLVKAFDDFMLEVGLSLVIFDISNTLPESVIFGNIEAEMRVSSESSLGSTARRSGSAEELQILGGLSFVKLRLDATISFINQRLTSYPHDIITSPPFKEWWLKYFGVLQRCTPEDFVKMVALEAGGKSDIDTSRLTRICTNLETALSTRSLDRDKTLLLTEYARIFYPVPCDEMNFFNAAEIASKAALDKKIKLLPPMVDFMGYRSIVWDYFQEADLGRLIQDAKGWRLVTGPRGSGKSTRILSILHAMPKDCDVLYVDLSTCRDISDVIHATISQLLLRDCKNYDEFVDRFGEFVANAVRTNAVFVFDNFEVDQLDGKARAQAIHGFESTLRKISVPHMNKCLFVLVSSSVPGEILNRSPTRSMGLASSMAIKPLTIPALTSANALVLAKQMLPVDPMTLMLAGRNLAGEMVRIAQTCSLATIRKMAAIYTIDPNATHIARKCMMEGIESELSMDEKLCAACMLTGLPHFNEGHAWALCRDAFQNNLLRWRVAWQGLVDVGWVGYSPCLGFWLPTYSVISTPVESSVPISLATQVKSYIFYWAAELVRLNNFSYDSSAHLLTHDKYRKHFRSVLCNFLSPDNAISANATNNDIFTEELRLFNPNTDLKPLGLIVTGRLERVLSLRYSDAFGLAVAQGVLATLASEKEGLFYMKALANVGSQLIRANRLLEAEELITSLTARSFIDFKDMPKYDRALFSALAANMYRVKKRFVDCKAALLAAQGHLEQDSNLKSVSEYTPGTLNWVKRTIIKCDEEDEKERKKIIVSGKKRCSVM